TGYTQPSLPNATAGFGRGTGGRGSANKSPSGEPISRALIIGNPDLEPETSVNHELGIIYHNEDRELNISLMAFQTDCEDEMAEDRYCASVVVGRDDSTNSPCEFGGNTCYFLSSRKNIDDADMEAVEVSVDYWLAQTLRLSSDY